MSIRVENSGERPVIHLPKTIDLSNSHFFKEVLISLYEEGHTHISVDFDKMEVIDSSGLGKLLLFHQRLKDRGGELNIINVKNENIRKMFRIIQLQKVLKIEGMDD